MSNLGLSDDQVAVLSDRVTLCCNLSPTLQLKSHGPCMTSCDSMASSSSVVRKRMKPDPAELSTVPSTRDGTASTTSEASGVELANAKRETLDPTGGSLHRGESTLAHGASFDDKTPDGLVSKAKGLGVAEANHNLPDVALIIEKSWCHKILHKGKSLELRSRPIFV